MIDIWKDCEHCGGTGEEPKKPQAYGNPSAKECTVCQGSKKTKKSVSLVEFDVFLNEARKSTV